MGIVRSGVVDCDRRDTPSEVKWEGVRLDEKSQTRLVDYDWLCAFTPAVKLGYDVDTIAEVVAMVDGENDGLPWVGIFKAKDGKFVTIVSGCDYTGWDCQSSGESCVCDSLAEAKSVIDANDLIRLDLP